MKNDLVSNISHELKTPISVVNVALEALQDFDAASDPEKTQRYIEISQKEMLRLSSLVDKVMDQSVNPDHEAPRTKVALASVGKEVIDSMSIRLNDRPLRIDYTHEGEPMVLAHVPDVKSVLYNLIDNAIKYSSEGVVKVHVKSCDNEAVITVKDQGIGIDPMYQDEVFDNFFRVPTDNIHNVKGYGLGLYHVKQIVEKYGGKIGMKSIPGEGSTFTIKWPLVR